MRITVRKIIIVLAGMLAGAGLAIGVSHAVSASPHTGTVVCSVNPCYIQMPNNGSTGLSIIDSKGPLVDNPFYIGDYNNDPMFWVNVGGAFSGDTPVCVTGSSVFVNESCINPDGTVTLHDSATNTTYTLWPGDIEWIHDQRGIR